MRVFVLGGTGSIGAPIVRALVLGGHDVWALARSDLSAAKLGEFGATPIAGDISSPEQWAEKFRSSKPSSMPPAISVPRWERSMLACSTCCCPRWPQRRQDGA